MSDEKKSNVVPFKKEMKFKRRPPQEEAEAELAMTNFKEMYVEEAIGMTIPILFDHLDILGFSSSDEGDDHRGSLVVEALRAYLYQKYDLPHAFHKIAMNIFTENEPGNLTLRDDLNIIFRTRKQKKTKETANTALQNK